MERAILFDLDGTLLDTLPDIRASLNGALHEYGYPPVSLETTMTFVGGGARRLVERAVPQGGNVDGVLTGFSERYTHSENDLTRPYAGMEELLKELKKRGYGLAVVTNKLQTSAEKVIEKFYPNLFDKVMGDSGMFPCKPDPTSARYVALTLRVAPRDCVLVGDGETDVFTARAAGMGGISTLWGYRTRAELEAAGAQVFAEDVPALAALLLKD